jgi:hypothetical protein
MRTCPTRTCLGGPLGNSPRAPLPPSRRALGAASQGSSQGAEPPRAHSQAPARPQPQHPGRAPRSAVGFGRRRRRRRGGEGGDPPGDEGCSGEDEAQASGEGGAAQPAALPDGCEPPRGALAEPPGGELCGSASDGSYESDFCEAAGGGGGGGACGGWAWPHACHLDTVAAARAARSALGAALEAGAESLPSEQLVFLSGGRGRSGLGWAGVGWGGEAGPKLGRWAAGADRRRRLGDRRVRVQ